MPSFKIQALGKDEHTSMLAKALFSSQKFFKIVRHIESLVAYMEH